MGNGGKSLNRSSNHSRRKEILSNTDPNTCKKDEYDEHENKLLVKQHNDGNLHISVDIKSGIIMDPISSMDFFNNTSTEINDRSNSKLSTHIQDISFNEIELNNHKICDPLLIDFNLPSFSEKSKKFPVSSFCKINEEKIFNQIVDSKQEDVSSEEDYCTVKNSKRNYYQNKKYQLYKTEICRSHSEVGYCKYGAKCQFAHTYKELRQVNRHPKYKTETCKTFWEEGSCPYGKRCCFIHIKNNELNNNCLFVSQSNNLYALSETDSMDESNQKDEDGIKNINNNTEKIETNFNQLYSEIDNSIEYNEIFVNESVPFLIENMKKLNHENQTVEDILSINLKLSTEERVQKNMSIEHNKETDENEYYNSLFIQDLHPFWNSNEINMWMDGEKSLFYINGRRDEFKTR